MKYLTPDFCDEYPDLIRVVEPIFKSYGGKSSFDFSRRICTGGEMKRAK